MRIRRFCQEGPTRSELGLFLRAPPLKMRSCIIDAVPKATRTLLPDSMRARDPRVGMHGVASREIRFCRVLSDLIRLEPRDPSTLIYLVSSSSVDDPIHVSPFGRSVMADFFRATP